MRAAVGHCGDSFDIGVHHHHIVSEIQLVCGSSEIGPVCLEDILSLFGHIECIETFINGMGYCAKKICVLCEKDLRVYVALPQIIKALTDLCSKIEGGGNTVKGSGDQSFHFGTEFTYP